MKKLAAFMAGLSALFYSTLALAVPNADTITGEITKGGQVVDTVGNGMITLVVAIMVFGFIIGMLVRKGK